MAVAPPDQTAANTPQKPLTRFAAQRRLGLFAGIDYMLCLVIVAGWVTLGYWKIFGDPTFAQLVWFALLDIVLLQVWIILLGYRALIFILDVQADINLMPEAAARIVVGFQQGRAASMSKP